MRIIDKHEMYSFLDWERYKSLATLGEDTEYCGVPGQGLSRSEMRKRVSYVLCSLEGNWSEKSILVYATEINLVPIAVANQVSSIELLVSHTHHERWVQLLTAFSDVSDKVTVRCVSDDGKLPYGDGSFDVAVYLNDALETNVQEHTLAVSELYRVLRSHGQMICVVPIDDSSEPTGLSHEEFIRISMDFQSEIDPGSSVLAGCVSETGFEEKQFQAFRMTKKPLPDPATFNTALTRELLDEYLKTYSGDQVLTDLVLFDYWAIRTGLPIASSGRINDKDLITSRAFRLWEYRQLIKALNLDMETSGSILDLGGASSPLTYYVALRGFDVTSLDINSDIMKLQRKTAEKLGINTLQSLVMDMQDLSSFDEGSFDKVMSASVLEHLSVNGQIQAMKELFRVLKPGGTATISFDFGIPAPGENPDLPPPHEPAMRSVDVYHRYVEAAGFEVVGEPFSCIFNRFWDSVNYCPAVIVLRKPSSTLSYSRPNNDYEPWQQTRSIVIGRFTSDSEVAFALGQLISERTRIEAMYHWSTTVLAAVEKGSEMRLANVFTLTDELKRISALLTDSERHLSLVQQSNTDLMSQITQQLHDLELARQAAVTAELEIQKLNQEHIYLADENGKLMDDTRRLTDQLKHLHQSPWVRLLKSLKMI